MRRRGSERLRRMLVLGWVLALRGAGHRLGAEFIAVKRIIDVTIVVVLAAASGRLGPPLGN